MFVPCTRCHGNGTISTAPSQLKCVCVCRNNRWNLTVSNVMRALIYEPIMEGRWVRHQGQFAPFNRKRRVAGVLAVFAASGILHEVMYLYATHRFTPPLAWLKYFCTWGVICVAESASRREFKRRGVEAPTWIKRMYFITLCESLSTERQTPACVEITAAL